MSIIIQLFAILLSYFIFQHKYYKYYIFSFYSIYTRIWEFGCGSLIYYYDIKLLKKYIFDCCIYLQIILMFCNIKHYLCFLAITIITIFQIIYSKFKEESIISNTILNFIGKISYSIYLIHYSNILLFNKAKAILIILIFSVILHYSIEKPFRSTSYNYILLTSYLCFLLFYYKIYLKDLRKSIQKNIDKFFVKDMCSYDILDNLLLSKQSILLLGDSHVLHYLRAFYDNNHKVILYHSYIYDVSLYKNNYYNDIIYLLKYKFDLIVISFLQRYNRNSTYEILIYHLINKLENITKNILVISDNPLFKINPNSCLESFNNCYGFININCSIIKPYNMIQFNYSKNLNVHDFSPNKYITIGNKCLFQINGISVYRDENHLNGYFVEKYLKKDIHFLLNSIFRRKIYKEFSVSTLKYHCLEEEYNIYKAVCINHKYKIFKSISKDVKYFN